MVENKRSTKWLKDRKYLSNKTDKSGESLLFRFDLIGEIHISTKHDDFLANSSTENIPIGLTDEEQTK